MRCPATCGCSTSSRRWISASDRKPNPWRNPCLRPARRRTPATGGIWGRCWAFIAPDRGAGLLQRCLSYAIRLWDQEKWFAFAVGAWTFCKKRAEETDRLHLELPRDFPLWREDGAYRPEKLGRRFYRQAADTAVRFGACYARTQERAVCSADYAAGQRF